MGTDGDGEVAFPALDSGFPAGMTKHCQTNISKWDRGFSTPTVDQLLVRASALGTTPGEPEAHFAHLALMKDLIARATKTLPGTTPRSQ